MNIVVDNLLTNYQLSGKGKLVLLLHGWGDSVQGLAGFQKELSRNYRVLALDLPGFGGTEAPKETWNLDGYARFIAAALQKLDLGQPYAVIGHSNGGALAIRAISLRLLQPEKVVLMAAAGIRTGSAVKRALLNVVAKTGNAATIWMPQRYRDALRKTLYDTAGSDMLVVPHLEETFKRTVRQDVQKDAVKIVQPVLLIYASGDEAVPAADGRRYHELIAGSRLEIIDGAGHFVHNDQPAAVMKLIREFLG